MMMNRIFLIITAAVCLAVTGCNSTKEDDFSDIKHSKEVLENRKKIDDFIKNFIPPEHEVPAVFAPEWANNPDHKEIEALTKRTYRDLPLFRQGKKLKSISLTYATPGVKKSFLFNVAAKDKAIAIKCNDEEKVQAIFNVAAKLPEVTVMPKGLPANLEDAVVRDLHMIYSFVLEPEKLAKSITLDVIPMMDLAKKTTSYAKKEYDINKRLCYKLEIQLRDMFGGGMIRLYVDGKDIVRIEIPTLSLDAAASSAFVINIDQFQTVNGVAVPSIFSFRGERFLLKEHKIGF